MSEIRFDRLHQRDVIIAPERLARPLISSITPNAAEKICPFCEGNEHLTPSEIMALREFESSKDAKGWRTRVVPNLYKALAIESPYIKHEGEFSYWEGFGAHEVLIDTPQHTTSMLDWSISNAIDWLTTLALRLSDLRRDGRFAYIELFKNQGLSAGASQEHSHTQIIALPLLPRTKAAAFASLEAYFQDSNRALLLDMLSGELEAQSRIVSKNGEFVAFCPYASSFAFELILTSTNAIPSLEALSQTQKEQLSFLLLEVLARLEKQLAKLEFNLTLSTPKLHDSPQESHQFYIRIMPRIFTLAGFELGSDIFINPLSPEKAAALLRGDRF